MNLPHTKEEKELIKQGYNFIAGIDEAGRGALAGPVVAAAVIMPETHPSGVKGVRDSKLISPKKREELFDEILKCCLGYGVGIIENDVIDEINIYQATKQAMKKAVESLENIMPEFLLIDAMKIETEIPQKSIVNGDTLCYSISCASIIAKVTRDRLMFDFHKEYPHYGFDRHKGYGTKLHFETLSKHGPCNIHRFSYNPIVKLTTIR